MATWLKGGVAIDAAAGFTAQAAGLQGPQRAATTMDLVGTLVWPFAMVVADSSETATCLAMDAKLADCLAYLARKFGIKTDGTGDVLWTMGYIDPDSELVVPVRGNTASLRYLLAPLLADFLRPERRESIWRVVAIR